MFWQLFILVIALAILYFCVKNRKHLELSSQLKSDISSLPIIGNIYMFLGTDEDRMTAFKIVGESALKYNGIMSMWLAGRLYIGIADPEIATAILKNCLEKDTHLVRFLQYAIGNGSIFAPVPVWRPRRKILAPTFNQRNLNQFVRIFAKQSSMLVENLRPSAGKGTFTLWNYLTTYTINSVCESTLGVEVYGPKSSSQAQRFPKVFDVFCDLVTQRICLPWLQIDFIYKLLPRYEKLKEAKEFMHNFVNQIIKSKGAELKEQFSNKKKCSDNTNINQDRITTFMEMLMDSSDGERVLSDLQIQEEVLVMVMAGTDTSAVGIGFTALMLSRHPHIQDKVYEELKEVFGESNRPIVTEDIPRLKYLEVVIKESMRLYPPVPIITRKIENDFTLPSGVKLLKGCSIIHSIYTLHRNPRYWGPDVDKFRPERFLDTEMKHPAQFMPFSYGSRGCLGYQYAMLSMKTALAGLLRHYRLLPATPLPPCSTEYPPLRLKFDIMMKDVDNFKLQLESRV